MTATTAWAHLPNAKHIDAIRSESDKYVALSEVSSDSDAWQAVCATIKATGRGKAYWKAHEDVWGSILDPIAALVAWDSSADLLDCTPDVLRAMIDLAEPPVCHQAALLLPYAIVRFGT